jgi:hypothetical protein
MKMLRISRAYFANANHRDNDEFYASIFTRDVHTGILPFRNGGKYPFTVSLARKNQKLEKQLSEFLHIGQFGGWSLEESLWDAVETLSQYLATFGDVYLEIVHEDDKNTAGLNGKKLEFLPLGKIFKFYGRYVQLVPLSDWKKGEKKFYVIPSSRIWHVKLPRKLGTPRKHKKMLKRLNLLSQPMPEFALKDGSLGGSAKYDFTKHRQSKDIAVEQVTSTWGSIRSLSRIQGTTEYYYIVNRLQATRSQALLREHLFLDINRLLKRLGVKNSIKVEGLKTSQEISDSIEKLENGTISFSEAIDVTKD